MAKGSNDVVIPREVTRKDFPSDFLFGTATSAYQIEGAATKYGRTMCAWDKFTFTSPEKIEDGSNASVAIDHYHRVKEDVKLLKKIGTNAYRFSISWSRILPAGRLNGGVNREGVKFYNDLIDLVLENAMEPFVTLFHFDVPQCLEEEYGGFLSSKIVEDYVDFSKVCFFEFGDRVKQWITMNEPWSFTVMTFVNKVFPLSAFAKDPTTDCYTVAHNILRAHARASRLYRDEFQSVQGGKIGITNISFWYEPLDPENPDDVAAAQRVLDFNWGWFTGPLVFGEYPAVMRKYVGERLPEFTDEEKNMLKGSVDFIGLNYYSGMYIKFEPTTERTEPYNIDQKAEYSEYRLAADGETKLYTGEKHGTAIVYSVPWGFRKLLLHVKNNYKDPIIYITENGLGESDDNKKTLKESLDDEKSRTKFLKDHVAALADAMREGARVKGYFIWSMFDNFEWHNGYKTRYGLFYVDYKDEFKRYPKNSAMWYMKFLGDNEDPKSEGDKVAATPKNQLSNKRRRDR